MNLRKMLRKEAETLPKDILKRNDAEELIISAKYKDNHFHHIMPDDDEIVQEILEHAAAECGFDLYASKQKEPPQQIVFKNRQAIGDILTMTCGVRDFKKKFPNTKVGVITTAMHLWDHNPHIDHNFRDSQHILEIGPGFLTNASNRLDWHMCNAFRVDMENKLGLSIPQGPIRPDIWMTEEEYKRPPIIDGAYWVFIYGGEPGWPAKQYHRWQKVINILKDDVQIVQLGVSSHPYPHLENVVDYVGKTENRHTGIRDLFNIFLHSQGSLGLVSMHMHLSAAFGNPSVVVAGAREPASFTNYFGHQYIQSNGTMFCGEHTACWKCKMEGCRNQVEYEGKKVPKCVEIIEPEEIADAVLKFYKGGRLEYGKKIPNKFFKNVVKEPKVFVAPKVEQIDNKYLQKWGFEWGKGSVTDQDWIFIKKVFEDHNVKTILEFGAGLSTLLFGTIVDKILTYETMPGWIKKIITNADPNKSEFIHWDGKNINLPATYEKDQKFDFAFVDGPAGGENREWSTKFASEHADLIIVHDAGRKPERKWQEKYLSKDFQLIAKGGHRCHLWKRREVCAVDDGRPLARMVTTCRGYGGSERSSINIMRMLLERGYRVELTPTGNISGEYLRNIPTGVVQQPWSSLHDPSDLTILYTSDTIWNYSKPQYIEHMNDMPAKRKVMILNYQLGGAGKVPWTLDWDSYMFLNSTKEGEFLERVSDAHTKVLAPSTDLTEFVKRHPDYNGPLRLIRHSSQGDNKHPEYTNKMIREILRIDSSIEFHFMPARSNCMDHPQVYKYPKNKPAVPDFLPKGNCFFYHLPPGYQDQGPKVIVEAMACGLPVIADNRYGAKDRVTDETGWLCDTYEDFIEVIKTIIKDPSILKIKGEAAREFAKEHFIAERWIEEIIG